MSKKKLLWIAVPLVVLLGVGAAGAGYKHYRGHYPDHMVERISDRLELNDEQRQKLETVKEAIMHGREQLRADRTNAVDDIIAEIRKPEIDEARALELIAQRMSRIDDMAKGIVAPMVEFHKSLDDTQREKIINLLESMRDWGHGRWHG